MKIVLNDLVLCKLWTGGALSKQELISNKERLAIITQLPWAEFQSKKATPKKICWKEKKSY